MALTHIKNNFLNYKTNKQNFINEMHNEHKKLFQYMDFINDADIESIEIYNYQIVIKTKSHGIKMIVDVDDKRIIPIEILNFGDYENEELNMIIKLLNIINHDDLHFFDIGANIGFYSMHIAKLFRKMKIYSFEPIPKTYSYFQRNLALNNINNINAYNFGFSNEEKNIEFYYYKEGSGNASLANLSELDDNSVEKVSSKVFRLDDFINQTNTRIDFIKCDVEGAELLVFQGGEKVLEIYKPMVFTEILRKWSAKFNYHPNDLINFFTSRNYLCFTINENQLKPFITVDDNTTETNYLFIEKTKIDKVAFLIKK